MPVSSPGPIVRSLSFSTRMSQNLQNFISSSYNTNQSGQSVCLVSSIDSSVSTTADLTAASEDGCRTLSHARQNLILLLCSHFIKKKKKKKRKKKKEKEKKEAVWTSALFAHAESDISRFPHICRYSATIAFRQQI